MDRRKAPEIISHEEFAASLHILMERETDLGVLLCYTNLLGGLVAANPAPYSRSLPVVLRLLQRLEANRDIPQTYTYYGLASPFLQVRAASPCTGPPTATRSPFLSCCPAADLAADLEVPISPLPLPSLCRPGASGPYSTSPGQRIPACCRR